MVKIFLFLDYINDIILKLLIIVLY